MWTRGILLVNDILDEHRSLTNLFENGNPLIWGALGWCVLLVFIVFMGYPIFKYARKNLEIKRTKIACIREKEKNRVKLGSAKIKKEKIQEAYKKESRKLKKKLKEELKDETKLKEELRKNSIKEFMFFFSKRKELDRRKADLKNRVSRLEEEMEVEIDRHLSICEELQNKVEECEEKIENVECELKENKKNFKEKMKKRKAICLVFLLILFANRKNMVATAQELKNTLVESFHSLEESQMSESKAEEPVFEDAAPEIREKNIEISFDTENNLREHMNYNFIIEKEQLDKTIENKVEDIIFLTDYPNDIMGFEQFLVDWRGGEMIELLPTVDYDEKSDLSKLLNEIAEDLEKPFLEKINDGKKIRIQIEWEQSAPKSTELETIINKRRKVLGMEESISIRRTIYYRLANDYQRLGLECLIQGKDGTQIYYYYAMSIYCCYCALGYEKSSKSAYSDEEILNYVKARYKDIMDNEKMGIPVEKVNSAEKMYSLLNK